MLGRKFAGAAVLGAALLLFCTPVFAGDVPCVVGVEADKAKSMIEEAGFVAKLSYDAGKPAGIVFAQSPGGFAPAASGSTVELRIGGTAPSAGNVPVDPPSNPAAGTGDGPDIGLPPTGEPPSVEPGPGPAAGTSDDTPLTRYPPENVPSTNGPEIPPVLGQKRDAALRALGRWKVREELTLSTAELVGNVINMEPMPGRRLAEGETVTLVVAVAEPPTTDHRSVPNVTNTTPSAAMQRLRAAGFKPVMRSIESKAAKRGTVVSQLPFPGSLAREGAEVRVRVGRGDGSSPAPANPPVNPGPSDPPANPGPENPPTNPGPVDPPVNPAPAVSLGKVKLRAPPAGESYPRAYGATFEWSKVGGATNYEWELQEERPSGAWERVQTEIVEGERYRPAQLKRGRFRWRVRALAGDSKGAWSDFFRLYMY